MARKQKTEIIFHNELKSKIAFGQSKHKDKQNLGFGKSTYKIYSYGTYNTYIKECSQYSKWLREEKGINKIKAIRETEQFAKEYLQHRLDIGVSVYTAKLERSALSMLYNKQIDIKMPIRDNKNITRSRKACKYEKHISPTGKYKDIFTIAAATGCRRKDIEKLSVSSFMEKGGKIYVKIEQSKGGRNRLAPVVPTMQQEVKNILREATTEGREKLFTIIPQKIDIHRLRREYARNIYDAFVQDKDFRDSYLKESGVPDRHEYRTFKDIDGNLQIKEIKTTLYKDRDGNIFNRDNLYAVSQALGHNRLDVSVTHYLKT